MTTKEAASVAAFVRHATKYGFDGVMEGARDAGLSYVDLVALQQELDKLERLKLKKWAPKHRLTAETRVRRLLGLPDEEEHT